MLNSLNDFEVNELMALVRLYMEMGIEQTTFYEETASHVENHYNELDETGVINALVCFKQVQSRRQLPVVHDLENALIENADYLEFPSVCSVLHAFCKLEEKRQNKKLMWLMKEKALKEVQKRFSKRDSTPFNAYEVLALLQSLKRMNADLKHLAQICDHIPDVVTQYQDGDLQELLNDLEEL